jgi:hypothetical protein
LRERAARESKSHCIPTHLVYRSSPVERSIGLAFTTLTIFAPLAHAAHPKQAVKPEGTASPFEFAAPLRQGDSLVRPVIPAPAAAAPGASGSPRAQSRVIYLDRDGMIQDPAGSGTAGGCTAAGGLPSGAIALALVGVARPRRRR